MLISDGILAKYSARFLGETKIFIFFPEKIKYYLKTKNKVYGEITDKNLMINNFLLKAHFMGKFVKRRDFLKILALGIIGSGFDADLFAQNLDTALASSSEEIDHHIRDYLHKMKNFDDPQKEDIKIGKKKYNIFKSTVRRLRRLEKIAGHGNFQIMSLDEGRKIAGNYSGVGKFTRSELDFMEIIFYQDAASYGFLGTKPLTKITDRINKNEVINLPYQGNYIYNGIPNETYKKIRRQLGKKVVLTSGVRGIMKQFLLFLNKAYNHNGNLSLASRSLAPPGYSFHGNGDFDVGQVGFGALNFTGSFTTTEVYKRLSEMGYLKLRYEQDNHLGVRFEPWHVKIA